MFSVFGCLVESHMTGGELDGYWKTVVNTLRDGIMIGNTRGAIVSVNKAFEKITGYSREELIGRTCDILQCQSCGVTAGHDGQRWCGFFQGDETEERRCRIRKKDGTLVNVLKNAAPLRDAAGIVIGAVETLADLSEITEKENQLEDFRRQLHSGDEFHGIVGSSAPMQRVFDMIENAAASDAPVIIYGESGTGKELVSRAIHDIGLRREAPFIKVNCARSYRIAARKRALRPRTRCLYRRL
jgi:PAS domain S-box-containing protein